MDFPLRFFTVPYFSLDRRDRTLTLQGGYFGFKCTAPSLEISIKSTYGGGGKDGLGVGEKYIFSFFLASLPQRYKPQGRARPAPSVDMKTKWPRVTVTVWSRDFFQKNRKLQAVYFPLSSFKQRTLNSGIRMKDTEGN